MAGITKTGCGQGVTKMIVSRDEPSRSAMAAGPVERDSVKLDQLFRQEGPGLLRYFRRATDDRDAAADMVQDAFLALAGSSKLGQLANPAAYLQRIARNLLFERTRRRRVASPNLYVPLDDTIKIGVPANQEDDLAASDLLAMFENAVAGMTPRTREVYLLHRSDGLQYKDIMMRLGISMGTVEYHMMRAIAHVDRVMSEA